MSDTTELLHREVYPRIFERADIVFPELNFARTGSDWHSPVKLDGSSPKRSRNDKTVITAKVPYYLLEQGGESISFWNYIQTRDNLPNNHAVLEQLAALAGYTLPRLESATIEQIQKNQKHTEILEATALYFHDQYNKTSPGSDIKQYLKYRGYMKDLIKRAGDFIGYYDSRNGLKTHLLNSGFVEADIIDTNLFSGSWGETRKLVFTIRDISRRIIGFQGRLIADRDSPKYQMTKGATGAALFLSNSSDGQEWIIVEGYLDAVTAYLSGFTSVVAATGKNLTDTHIEDLMHAQIKNVTLCFDCDEAGRDGTRKAIIKLRKAEIPAYVAELPDGKDPHDVLTQEDGAEAFKETMATAIPATKWEAFRLIEESDTTTEAGRDRLIRKALEWDSQNPSAYESDTFLRTIAEQTQADIASLLYDRDRLFKRKRDEQRRIGLQRTFREGLRLLESGDDEAAEKLLQTIAPALNYEATGKRKPLAEFLQEKYETDMSRPAGELLGYNLDVFRTIASDIEGLQAGLYIIGAETNVGKTALLAALFMDALDANPDLSGVFFSLDDSKAIIVERWIASRTNYPINSIRKSQGSYKNTEERKEAVSQAYKHLTTLAAAGRLTLFDIAEVDTIENLEAEIESRTDPSLIVAIDGLYNLSVGDDFGSLREANIERANRIKALVDRHEIPLIATAELRKTPAGTSTKVKQPRMDDLMETGKFAYNANLVWLLWSEDPVADRTKDTTCLKLSYEKNKLSDFKGVRDLQFERDKSRITIKTIDGF